MFGDFLYTLRPRDLQVTQLEYYDRTGSSTAVGIPFVVGNDEQVPDGRVLILLAWGIMLEPNAGNAGLGALLETNPFPGPATIYRPLWGDTVVDLPAGLQIAFGDTGTVILPPGGRWRMTGNFANFAVANTIRYHGHGVLIPRGSFAF